MPVDRSQIALKAELARLAKLSNIKAGLPFGLRLLPAAAILAGAAVAKATRGRNHIEERLLGPGESISLSAPGRSLPGEIQQNGDNKDIQRV